MIRHTLFPFQLAYYSATSLRNWAYDVGLRKAKQVEAKVISIGNLTVGGTGKTPMTIFLIDELLKRGLSAGVVSRGYGRLEKGVLEVEISPRAVERFGDEPVLIKTAHPEIPIFVGEKRSKAAESLLAHKKVDVLIGDDAFQHRALHRDLNLLLIDATEPLQNYSLLPVGRAREASRPAFSRCDFVVITKCNLVDEATLGKVKDWVEARTKKPIIQAEYILKNYRSTLGQKTNELKDKVILVSGIAKPYAFEAMLKDKLKIAKHNIYEDHHRYTDLDIEILLDSASTQGVRWIVTTAKDEVKLMHFPRLRERLWVADLSLNLKGELQELYESLDRLAR
ncbi:MAG: tetraacyldisaccharide 4'-kinase [Bdellovibrionales bacterium]